MMCRCKTQTQKLLYQPRTKGEGSTMCAAMTRPVFNRAFPPAFMAAADTALQEQKLKRNCTNTVKRLRMTAQHRSSAA